MPGKKSDELHRHVDVAGGRLNPAAKDLLLFAIASVTPDPEVLRTHALKQY
jgi:hypothetical protein